MCHVSSNIQFEKYVQSHMLAFVFKWNTSHYSMMYKKYYKKDKALKQLICVGLTQARPSYQ